MTMASIGTPPIRSSSWPTAASPAEARNSRPEVAVSARISAAATTATATPGKWTSRIGALSRASYPSLSIPSSTIGLIVPGSDLAVEDLVGDLAKGGAVAYYFISLALGLINGLHLYGLMDGTVDVRPGDPASWLNRIEAQFTALRYFALDGTDRRSHKEQGSMIRRSIIWRTATPTTPAYVRSSPEPTWPDQRVFERPVLSPRSWC